MFPQPIPQERPTQPSAGMPLSLQDLLDDCGGRNLSEYLSLSLTRLDGDILISLTTTGSEPVTYSAIISATAAIDLQSPVFMLQHDKRGV